MEHYVQCCVEYNVSVAFFVLLAYSDWVGLTKGGIIDEDEEKVKARYNQIINQLSRKFNFVFLVLCILMKYTGRFSDHVKAADDLKSFGKLNEARTYKLVTSIIDTQVDLKTMTKSLVRDSTSETTARS